MRTVHERVGWTTLKIKTTCYEHAHTHSGQILDYEIETV